METERRPFTGAFVTSPVDWLYDLVELPGFARLHQTLHDDLWGRRLGEVSRSDRLALSRHTRARRDIDDPTTRRIESLLPPNLRGLTAALLLCDPSHLYGLLAELRHVDTAFARPVPVDRLRDIAARRLDGESLPARDRKHLERTLTALNPPQPVAVKMAGSIASGAPAHLSATSAQCASLVAMPNTAGCPYAGISEGDESLGWPIVRLADPPAEPGTFTFKR
jgi:hypothetical protein